ncbi:suppressor protein SRP40-like [Plectropomus leopardus]|nr:suppressor protein SRP40-like [Plectropomus leopardus]
MEEGLVVASRCTSRSSLLNIKAMLPSAAHKRSSRTSDDSDEESVTELTGGSAGGRGGGYKLRPGTNLSSSSCSSSSSSLSACPQSGSPPKQTSGVFSLPPEASADCDSGVKERLSLHTDSHSENLPKTDPDSHPGPAHTHCLTLGRALPEEEEKEVMVEEDSQDVNLLTLTFGRQEEEEEEEETKPEPSSASEVYDTTSTPPSLTRDTKEVTMETVSCSVNAKEEREEEEKECSGYMVRPCQDVLQNFL